MPLDIVQITPLPAGNMGHGSYISGIVSGGVAIILGSGGVFTAVDWLKSLPRTGQPTIYLDILWVLRNSEPAARGSGGVFIAVDRLKSLPRIGKPTIYLDILWAPTYRPRGAALKLQYTKKNAQYINKTSAPTFADST